MCIFSVSLVKKCLSLVYSGRDSKEIIQQLCQIIEWGTMIGLRPKGFTTTSHFLHSWIFTWWILTKGKWLVICPLYVWEEKKRTRIWFTSHVHGAMKRKWLFSATIRIDDGLMYPIPGDIFIVLESTYRKVLNTVPSRIVSRLEYSPHQKLEILIESSLK